MVTWKKKWVKYTLRKKCPSSKLFWSAFSDIKSEYGHLLRSNSLLRLKENRQILSKIISRNDDERSKINGQTSIKNRRNRSSRPEVFLRKGVLKLCSKFTGERPCRSAISIKLLWNRTLAWVFSCKFAAYIQNTSGRLLLKEIVTRKQTFWSVL